MSILIPEGFILLNPKGLGRHLMPQVKMKNITAFQKRFNGDKVFTDKTLLEKIAPTQKFVSETKVARLVADHKELERVPVIVTEDGYCLDGHHRLCAALRIMKTDPEFKVEVLMVPVKFHELYIKAHSWLEKSGIEKLGKKIDGRISRITSKWNSLQETWKEFVEDVTMENNPMERLINQKLKGLNKEVESVRLLLQILKEKEKEAVAKAEKKVAWLTSNGKAEEAEKAKERLEQVKAFVAQAHSKTKNIEAQLTKIVKVLLDGFLSESFAKQEIVSLLDGSIYQLAITDDSSAAVDVLKGYTSEPENLLSEIKAKIEDLKGFTTKIEVSDKFWSDWDTSYPKAYLKAKAKLKETQEAKEAQHLRLLLSDFATAGKVWLPKMILELVGNHMFGITKTYEGQSVVKQNGGDSFSLPLKENDVQPASADVKRFLSSATAEALDMPILLSSGGGMQFLNPVFLRAFKYVTESLVDIKAYIASANSSAVRKTIVTDMYVGTQVHVLLKQELDEDNNPTGNFVPVMVDGKPVAIASAAEGSHWFPRSWGYAHKIQSATNHVAVQIRGLSQDFMTDIIHPAAESHKQHTAKTSDWLSRCRGQFYTNALAVVREAIKETKPLKSLKQVSGQEAIVLLSSKQELEDRAPGSKSWTPASRKDALIKLEPGSVLNNEQALIHSRTITLGDINFWNYGELSLENFRKLGQQEKKQYLNKIAKNALRSMVPEINFDLFKVSFVSSPKADKSGSHLLVSIRGKIANVAKLSRYICYITKRDLEDRAQAKIFSDLGYWPSLGATSFDDFLAKWKSGHKFVGFENAFAELKKLLPKMVEDASTKWGISVGHLRNRKGLPLNEWSKKWFSLSKFEGKTLAQVKAANDGKVEVPEYKRSTLWGWPCKSKSVFIKGIAVDHVSNNGNEWRFLDGEMARQDIPVASGLDGIKCEHKKLVVGKTEKLLAENYHIVSWDHPQYGVEANGFQSFKTENIILSKETEKVSLGIMRIFKTGKVVVTSQFLEKLPTDLYRTEKDSSVIHATEESSEAFKAYLGESWEWIEKAFNMLQEIPTGLLNTSNYYKKLESVDDRLSPSKLFLNLMCINSRHFEAPTFWSDIAKSVSSGKNSEINSVLEALDADHDCSTALKQAMIEMVNSRLNQACKGSIIKGKYFVVKNFELLPNAVMVVHKKYRSLNGAVEGAAWRFPIATATSLMNVKIVFSDDKEYLPTLMEAGICDAAGEMADVVLMNSKCKLWFQQDDDGDQFGIIIDPKPITEEDFCKLEWHIKNAKKDYGSDAWVAMVKFAKKLYRKLEAKIVIALTKLRRHDYPSVDIEMETIPGGKALFKFLDENGVSTKEFRELSSENLQGPVGLVSDLMTVILASGEHDHELVRVARTLGYLLQHCIDSAKKNKLMIPAAVLMHDDFWTITSTGRHEMVAIGNSVVMEWNEAWKNLDLARIKSLEKQYSFLPNTEEVLSSLKYDHKYLYFAPCTLLSHLQKRAKAGSYGTIDLFGAKYPVPSTAIECIDETRYVSAHVFNVVDVTNRKGERRSWSQMANFRTIRIEDYITTVRRPIDDEKKVWKLFWPEACDGDGYAAYWTRCPKEERGFGTLTTYSIPNYVFKDQLRFSMEMIFGGHENLVNTSAKWRKEPQDVAFETLLSQPYTSTTFFNKPIRNKHVSEFLFEKDKNKKEVTWSSDAKLKKSSMSFCTGFLTVGGKKELTSDFLKAFESIAPSAWSTIKVAYLNPESGKFNFENFYLENSCSTATKEAKATAKALLTFLREVLHSFTLHQLAQPCWQGLEYVPNLIQKFFASKVNTYFRKDITSNGRKEDRVYRIPRQRPSKTNPELFAFLRKPDLNWFKGDYLVYKQIAVGVASDLVVKSIGSIPVWDFCEYTSTIDIHRDGAVDKAFAPDGAEYEKINVMKLQQVVSNYSVAHLHLVLDEDGEGVSINDCPCCKARIRKQVAEVQRSAITVRGTEAYENNRIGMAAVKTAITCLESVKDQAEFIIGKAMDTGLPAAKLADICEETGFGLTPETVLLHAKAYGSTEVKTSFGFASIEQSMNYDKLQSLMNNLNIDFKKFVFNKIEERNGGHWWQQPLTYIADQFNGKLKDKNYYIESYDMWDLKKYYFWLENKSVASQPNAAEITRVGKLIKANDSWEKVMDKKEASVVIIWAANLNGQAYADAVAWCVSNDIKYFVVNNPEHLKQLAELAS